MVRLERRARRRRRPSAGRESVERGKITYALLDLTEAEHAGYYGGMANRTLWPLFHYRIDLTSFEHEWYRIYREVARLFAEQLIGCLQPGDRVWVQDFHLIPLGHRAAPAGLRRPARLLPAHPVPAGPALHDHAVAPRAWRRICAPTTWSGFQTPIDREHFVDYAARELGAEPLRRGDRLRVGGRTVAGAGVPIGIDVQGGRAPDRLGRGPPPGRRPCRHLGDRALIIGVDRLDYSKGILERLRGFQVLLSAVPAAPPQGRAHADLGARAARTCPSTATCAGRSSAWSATSIGRYGEADWMPLRYLNRTHSRRTLAGYYRAARVGLVTPLARRAQPGRRGICRGAGSRRSRRAGAVALRRCRVRAWSGALIVNPYDVYGVAAALDRALTMPLDERQERHRQQLEAIRRNDIEAWRRRCLAALDAEPHT